MSNNKQFNQPEYWRSRISGNIDLGVVGYRSLGSGYNELIYRRRLEILDEIIRSSTKPLEELKVLEIGCGSGFYVDYWHKLGVRHLTGVDISPDSIALMQQRYPEYSFAVVDGTLPNAFALMGGLFDIITIFDVIYHVVDDSHAVKLLNNAAAVLNKTGNILITDCLGGKNYGFVKHVRYRSRSFYENFLKSAGLVILKEKLMFNFLHPPLARYKILDYCIAGIYYLAGMLWRINDAIGRSFGLLLYYFDRMLFAIGIRMSNQEMLVIGHCDEFINDIYSRERVDRR